MKQFPILIWSGNLHWTVHTTTLVQYCRTNKILFCTQFVADIVIWMTDFSRNHKNFCFTLSENMGVFCGFDTGHANCVTPNIQFIFIVFFFLSSLSVAEFHSKGMSPLPEYLSLLNPDLPNRNITIDLVKGHHNRYSRDVSSWYTDNGSVLNVARFVKK